MDNNKSSQDKLTHIIRWVARIWSIVIIGIVLVKFLEEILFPHTEGQFPAYEYLIPFTLFLSVVGLALAWRWEVFGGAITVISVLVNLMVYMITGRTTVGAVVVILTPVAIPGILFLVCGLRSRGESLTSSV